MFEKYLEGIGISDEIKIGKAFLYDRTSYDDVNITGKITKGDIEFSIKRFRKAVNKAMSEIDQLFAKNSETLGREGFNILDAQKEFLNDPEYIPRIEELIKIKLYSPERAVHLVTEKYANLFDEMDDSYLNERGTDVRDAGNRLKKQLVGTDLCELSDIKEPIILIADELSAADTAQLDRNNVIAFVTSRGGKTSHTAMFAKLMNIPAIVGVPNLLNEVDHDDILILDCSKNILVVAPEKDTINKYATIYKKRQKIKDKFNKNALLPSITQDGFEIDVLANIVSAEEVPYALKKGAKSIGLVRTESIYMAIDRLPNEAEQFEIYKSIAVDTREKNGATLRTIDLGGDKAVYYLNMPPDGNPALGYRGIRLGLGEREIFHTQLKALLRASAFGEIRIMFPMITQVEEIVQTMELLEEIKVEFTEKKIPFNKNLNVGMMLETPASIILMEDFAKYVDFFSIGTNDLVQFLLAADRDNTKIAYLYDYTNPAVLRIIDYAVRIAKKTGVRISMCGDLASDLYFLPFLIGCGIKTLSVPIQSIAKMKHLIREYNYEECKILVKDVLKLSTKEDVQKRIDKDVLKINEPDII